MHMQEELKEQQNNNNKFRLAKQPEVKNMCFIISKNKFSVYQHELKLLVTYPAEAKVLFFFF